jgi:hypothetical protein
MNIVVIYFVIVLDVSSIFSCIMCLTKFRYFHNALGGAKGRPSGTVYT